MARGKRQTASPPGQTCGSRQPSGPVEKLRGHMDTGQYKHVVLRLIFLKYISHSFEVLRARLITEQAKRANPEALDEYRAENVFWVPPEARWSHLQANAKNPAIGIKNAKNCYKGDHL
jgi:type I restriction enzyme M protein